MNDDELKTLFSQNIKFEDQSQFHTKIMRRLKIKEALRQSVILLMGFIGGVFALSQFLRFPRSNRINDFYASPKEEIRVTTSDNIMIGAKFFDDLARYLADVVLKFTHYVDFLYSQDFLWFCFLLCIGGLALYYADAQGDVV